MAGIEIKEIGVELLSKYAEIPISFKVESVLQVELVDRGLEGFFVVEKKVKPYLKNYDIQNDLGDRPSGWARRFDVSKWGFFLALEGQIVLGGAAVAVDTSDVNMLENRKDLAVLWDIRVHPNRRRSGIGTKLFNFAADWARKRGYKQLKVETQDVNVPACRFYAKQGCSLGAIHRYAYVKSSEVAHEAMFLWYLEL